MDVFYAFGTAGDVAKCHVGHLAGDHPGRARRRGQFLGQPRRRLARLGEQAERPREQGVAGENGHRLAEPHVRGRPAATERVVVHRRKVVVNQAVAVNRLHRHRREPCGMGPPRV